MRRSETLEGRVREQLAELRSEGLMRSLRAPAGIDLSSNDYLGLARHRLLAERMAAALNEGGCGSTGSRLLRGHREAFAGIEQRFAAFKGTEASLYFSSGYLANLAVLSTFPQAGDVIFSAERNHASLIDGMRLSKARRIVFDHRDLDALEALLKSEPCEGQRFIVVESLFSMDGDMADLRGLAILASRYAAVLVVDEAHATGVYGASGSGLIEAAGNPTVWLSINAAGKALGAAGAFAAGPAWAIEYLVQRARPFIFSTAPPPAIAAAIDAALDLVAAEPERRAQVLALARFLRERLGLEPGSQIIPVLIGENDRAVAIAGELQREGFDIRAIRPPTVPAGTARLRISLNAGLTTGQLERFSCSLEGALQRFVPCFAASS
jgi:8-amino-7-oxononanoate synthase